MNMQDEIDEILLDEIERELEETTGYITEDIRRRDKVEAFRRLRERARLAGKE